MSGARCPIAWVLAGCVACSSEAGSDPSEPATGSDTSTNDDEANDDEASGDEANGDEGSGDPQPRTFVAVTFNSGTTDSLDHESDGDGYGPAQVEFSDSYYGNGLAWLEAVAAVSAWLDALEPEIIAFQEVFDSEECPNVPPEARVGYVCSRWQPGSSTVVAAVLGRGYQVACHLGKADKCVGVHRDFGRFVGCEQDLCLDHLEGASVEGCGSGSRVGRGRLELEGGGELTIVSYHGTSGLTEEEAACRLAQVEQIFVDLDGAPAANGARNLILGDLNTDPFRVPEFDPSAARWLDFVARSFDEARRQRFWFVTDAGVEAPPSYFGGFNIDHIASDFYTGSCEVPGLSPGVPPIYPNVYFDHKPHVCELVAGP